MKWDTAQTPSTFKHDVELDDIRHAVDNAYHSRWLEPEPRRPDIRQLCVGVDRAGRDLEVIIVHRGTTTTIIHAMKLRWSTVVKYLWPHESFRTVRRRTAPRRTASRR